MANKPSIKTLEAIFGMNAAKAREVLEMNYTQLLAEPEGKRRHDECHHAPPSWDLQMNILNSLGEFHGLESCEVNGKVAEYLNAGEMYAPTLIYYQSRFRVQDLGTFIERNDKRKNHD